MKCLGTLEIFLVVVRTRCFHESLCWVNKNTCRMTSWQSFWDTFALHYHSAPTVAFISNIMFDLSGYQTYSTVRVGHPESSYRNSPSRPSRDTRSITQRLTMQLQLNQGFWWQQARLKYYSQNDPWQSHKLCIKCPLTWTTE